MEGSHRSAATHFGVCTLSGIVAPTAYAGWIAVRPKAQEQATSAEVFEDCIELPCNAAVLDGTARAAYELVYYQSINKFNTPPTYLSTTQGFAPVRSRIE